MQNEKRVLITPSGLKQCLRDAFRAQNDERFEQPLINYLGWQIFGQDFPLEKDEDWQNVYDFNPDEVLEEKT